MHEGHLNGNDAPANNSGLASYRTWILGAVAFLTVIAAAHSQTLTVTANPSAITMFPGQRNLPVAVTLGSSSYTGPVTVTLSGLPSGVSAAPLTLAAGGSGTLMLSATVSAGQEGFPDPNGGTTPITSWTAKVKVVAAAGATQATAGLALTLSISNPAFAPTASEMNLPVVQINTGGVPILSKTVDVPGTITITSADGQTSYLPNSSDSDNTATFHLHGNSTANEPKLPYHVKLGTSLDLLHTMGLKCPYVNSKGKAVCDKAKSYDLINNYDDKSLMRDWVAYTLAASIPIGGDYLNEPANSPTPSGTSTLLPWAPHSLFVEVFVNGEYEGTYQLVEELQVDNNKVNITELTESDTSPSQVTGGYLLEIDKRQAEAYNFITPHGVYIGVDDPDYSPDPNVPQQTSYIQQYVLNAEAALFASNFTDPTLGWRGYFDDASAVNFYIVNDLMGNEDGSDFFSSDYLYKDANNPYLYMGPVWDFNTSSGSSHPTSNNPVLPNMQVLSPWYARWFADPSFRADVTTQWNALKSNGVFDAWLASIPAEAQTLTQASVNNFSRWPNIGIRVSPNPEAAGTYNGEITYMVNWLKIRMAYLDSLFNPRTATATRLSVPAGTLRDGSPVILAATATGGISPAGNIAFLCNGIPIGIAPMDAGGTATLTTSMLPAGTDLLSAAYLGNSTNAFSVSSNDTATVESSYSTTVTTIAGSIASGFSASVVPNSGTAVPTGTVTFTPNQYSGTVVPLSGSSAVSVSAMSLSQTPQVLTATYSGDNNFSPSSATLILSVPAPTFSLPAGTYASGEQVTIGDVAPGASIYYTTDGTAPTSNSSVYSEAIVIGQTETIRAIAIVKGMNPSPTASAAYTVSSSALAISLTPSSLTFTPTSLGYASAPQTITVTNTGAAALAMRSFLFSGANASMFTLTSKTCATSLAVGASCNLSVAFTPTSLGTLTGSLAVSDNALGSPQTVSLSGTGAPLGSATIVPASLNFPTTFLGSTSAPQTLTITNTGASPLVVQSYLLNGSGSGSFAITAKTCSSTLAPSASCTISIAFKPVASGTLTATMTANDSAEISPQTVSLSGSGAVADKLTFEPETLSFPSTLVGETSVAQSVTVTNTGTTAVTVSSYLPTGTNASSFELTAKTCTTSLASGASCTVSIAFRPSAAGSLSAELATTDSGVGSPQLVALSGIGLVENKIAFSPSSLTFASTRIGSLSTPQTITVTNIGTSTVTVDSYHVTGSDSGSFEVTSKSCQTSLAAGASCTVSIAFRPSASGTATAALTVTDNGVASPQSAKLAGVAAE